MEERAVHPLNVPSPIDATLEGMVTDLREAHPQNAPAAIVPTVSGTEYYGADLADGYRMRLDRSLSKRTPSAEE